MYIKLQVVVGKIKFQLAVNQLQHLSLTFKFSEKARVQLKLFCDSEKKMSDDNTPSFAKIAMGVFKVIDAPVTLFRGILFSV